MPKPNTSPQVEIVGLFSTLFDEKKILGSSYGVH